MPHQVDEIRPQSSSLATSTESIVAIRTADSGPAASGSWPLGDDEYDGRYWTEALRRSRWRQYVSLRIEQLAEHVGSAGYPSLEALNRALSQLDRLLPEAAPTPNVLPSEDGGVDLIWQRHGWDVQIELDEGGEDFVWTRDRKSGEVITGDLDEFRDVVVDLLNSLSDE